MSEGPSVPRPSVVSAPAEIDLATAGDLDAALRAAAADSRGTVVVDFAAVTFVGSLALRVLGQHAERLAAQQRTLVVRRPPARLLRLIAATGWTAPVVLELPRPRAAADVELLALL